MRTKRSIPRLIAGVIAAGLLLLGGQALPAVAAGGPKLAAGKAVSASSTNGSHSVANINDGNQSSYWESATNALPQWAQIELAGSTRIGEVQLKVPASWSARTQTLSVQASNDGTNFSTLVSSATYKFNPSSGNTVAIDFGAANATYVRVDITANSGSPAGQLSELSVFAPAATGPNLAVGKTLTASSTTQTYVAANANDANQSTYWESANNAFPQWLRVDLGSAVPVNEVILKLPAATSWATRTETLAVQGSTDGSTFNDLVASAGYTFNPATGNTVDITFSAATTRYLRLNITANTGWPAGQISEFEVYGPSTGDVTAPTAPANLAYTQPASGQIRLTWSASTDNTGVTGYDIYANGTLRTSVAGTVLTYTDSQPDTATVTYYVRAKDAAGNQSANSNSVTRTGTGTDTQAPTAPGSLAYTQPASGQIKLTWTASSDNIAVTGYEVFAGGVQIGTTTSTVLTYTDSQPDTATVSYFVRAKDAAGNESANSNTVTRTGSTVTGTNLALGKPIVASSTVQTFVAANANDGDVTTYWEGTGSSTLTVSLGSNVDTSSVVVKLNPSTVWGARTQTVSISGREQSATTFTQLTPATVYSFDPATGNTVTIPLSARVADVRLTFSTNSGAGGGQAAELQVIGVPGPNPDLTVSGLTASPAAPVETDPITLSATVKNIGTTASSATDVNLYLGTTKVGTAAVGALAAGASSTVTANIGARDAGSYQLTAKVDEANTVIEQNETNNSFTAASALVVKPVDTSDLVASPVAWSPSNPSAGNNVNFSVAIRNQGTVAAASGAHAVTLTLSNATTGAVVTTLTGSYSGAIAVGATTAPVNLGGWTAVNGKYTVKTVIAVDTNEVSIKQANNTSSLSLFVGRGANMPYDSYEAEDGVLGGGATVLGPNRTIGDPAGEASGRKAVNLSASGASVQFTTRASTNTLVTRFSIPDGTASTTLNIYVDGTFLKTITLTSQYAWLYGAEAGPGNDASAGSPRHIYDEANVLLGTTVPAGHTIKLQKDAANSAAYYNIDYINLEQATAIANPDPTRYVVPTGFTQQAVQSALDTARQDTTKLGVYLPAGDYQTTSKFNVYGRAVNVIGAGPWFTRFSTPSTQTNTDAGFTTPSTANGTTFSGFAFFGNYTSRIDGPGKVFDFSDVSDITVDDIWVEHTICLLWGTNVDNLTITDNRIRDIFADGVNLTNGSTGNLVSNNEARSTGDDSFALFPATDHNSTQETGNVFQNLSALTTWRAAGLAVYGGGGNTFSNLYIADTLVYSGITIGSLQFGSIPALGFESSPQTTFSNISLVRDGGHFWGAQTFPALWIYSAEYKLQGLRISDVDITEPTYSGIMFQTKWNGSTSLNPIQDTIFTDISVSGAHKSGDAYDAKSGFGLWANPLPEAGQGPAVGSVTFNGLTLSDNAVDIQNTTTFTITVNN